MQRRKTEDVLGDDECEFADVTYGIVAMDTKYEDEEVHDPVEADQGYKDEGNYFKVVRVEETEVVANVKVE